MGTLRVGGNAKHIFPVDYFEIKIQINATCKSSGEAIETGKKRTEQFLRLMKSELSLGPESFTLNDFTVKHTYDKQYGYEKSISINVEADLALVEKIAVLMQSLSEAEYKVYFNLNNQAEKERLVLREAIENSRRSAEIIAASFGEKVVGMETANYQYSGWDEREKSRGLVKSVSVDFDTEDMSRRLQNPTKTVSKSIDIIWITE